MDKIRIQNLRGLRDTGFIEVKPITFLLGSNSSGKSTFLRTFPLIKQSVASRTTGPILWYGDLVDFGSFDEVISKISDESMAGTQQANEICFAYKFKLPRSPKTGISSSTRPRFSAAHFRLYQNLPIAEDLDITLEVGISAETRNRDNTFCRRIILSFADQKIEIEINSSEEVTKFEINSKNRRPVEGKLLVDPVVGGFLPHFFTLRDKGEREDDLYQAPGYGRMRNSILRMDIRECVKGLIHHKSGDQMIVNLIRGFSLGSSQEMLKSIKSMNTGGEVWKKNVGKWDVDNEEYQKLQELIIGNSVPLLLSFCDEYVSIFARHANYIGPARATAERYYRSQNLAVGEVDYQGKNLAMFIRNLTDSEKKDFAGWTEKYFSFSVHVSSSGDHVSLKLREKGQTSDINLADTGFGFSQILPILTQLWWLLKKSRRSSMNSSPITFAIEQPELHLHPKLQALLADAFIAAVNEAKGKGIDLRLIIETHSPTLINRLGHRIAKGKISKDEVSVVLFNRSSSLDPVHIDIASYDDDGFLDNWPIGFFEPDVII
jgi:predicted ATPase